MLGSSWSGTVLPCKLLSVRYTKAKRVWSTLETQLKVVEEPLISQGKGQGTVECSALMPLVSLMRLALMRFRVVCLGSLDPRAVV